MELDNQIAKHTYISLLADVLKKKIEVLTTLLDLTEQQDSIITTEPFNDEEFLNTISAKEGYIDELLKLEDGFERIYSTIKEELTSSKDKFADEISKFKEYIGIITDLSVKLQSTEARNKQKMETYLAAQRNNLRKSRISNQTVANYYKTTSLQHEAQSYFYDKKK